MREEKSDGSEGRPYLLSGGRDGAPRRPWIILGLFLVRAIDGAFAGVAEAEQLIVHAVVGAEGGFPGIELLFAVFGGDAGRERERKDKDGEERGGFHRAKKTRFAARTIALG